MTSFRGGGGKASLVMLENTSGTYFKYRGKLVERRSFASLQPRHTVHPEHKKAALLLARLSDSSKFLSCQNIKARLLHLKQ